MQQLTLKQKKEEFQTFLAFLSVLAIGYLLTIIFI